MSLPLKNHTALVTGAASGIGKACALHLAALGAAVAVSDRELATAQTLAHEIQSAGGRASALALNVANRDCIADAIQQAEQALAPIDILVNSAGVILIEPLLDFSIDSWDKVMAVNVTGTFLTSQCVARGMVARRYGRIINIASVSGLRAGVGRTAYGTSKAALAGLTRQFALELGSHGVTTNAVAPGIIETPMTLNIYSDETWSRVLEMIPAGRCGLPDDIAAAVAWLASPAAAYVNGEILTVDGGYMASGMTQTGRLQA